MEILIPYAGHFTRNKFNFHFGRFDRYADVSAQACADAWKISYPACIRARRKNVYWFYNSLKRLKIGLSRIKFYGTILVDAMIATPAS
jgi:hypothetical protein